MRGATERQVRFVAALLRGAECEVDAQGARIGAGDIAIGARELAELEALGVVRRASVGIEATAFAPEWLRRERAMAGCEKPVIAEQGGASRTSPAFFAPHHLAAGDRVRRLFDRAQLLPRVTMAYSPIAATRGAARRAGDITDMAAEARKGLAEIHALLPDDCAGVVIDVCGYEKGLQAIETERGWPRRSAKLVLRIGLEHLARHYGLVEMARGPESGKQQGWIGEGGRPTEVG